MARYDAFGREIGEDPLAEQGWRMPEAPPAEAPNPVAPSAPAAPAGPAGLAPPPQAPTGPAASRPSTPRRARRWPVRLVILGVVVWGLARAGDVSVEKIGDAVDDITNAVPSPATETETAERPAEGPAPVGLRAGSFIRADVLGPAVAKLRAGRLGRVTQLTVRPDRIDANLVTADDRIRIVQVLPGPTLKTITTTDSAFRGQDAFGYDRIDPTAAQRLVRAGARRMKRRVDRVDYVVVTRFGEGMAWIAYFKDGSYAFGDAAGRFVRAYD